MTNNRKLMLAVCVGLGLAAGGAAMAVDFGNGNAGGSGGMRSGMMRGGFGHRDGGMQLRMLGRVGLTDAQKSTIMGLLKDNQAKFQAVREEDRAAREAIEAAKPDDSNYGAEVDAAATKIGDAAKQRVELMGQMRTAVEGVLTADQKAKLVALRTQEGYARVFGGDGQMGRGNHQGWQGRGNGEQAGGDALQSQ